MIAMHTSGAHRAGAPPERLMSAFAAESALGLVRFAYLLTGDRHRAEDLVQDVFLAMHRRFGEVLPLDNPVGYARRALANQNITWARRAASSEIVVDAFDDRPTRTDGVDDLAERDRLWQALRRLPVRQRTVLVLRFYNDASDADIADTLDCRRGTVRSLASRGLAALRDDPTLDYPTLGGEER